MTSQASLLFTLREDNDIVKVLNFLGSNNNFSDFAVTSMPMETLLNIAFGNGVKNEKHDLCHGSRPTCVIVRITGNFMELYQRVIDMGFPQFLISSRSFSELVSSIFTSNAALQSDNTTDIDEEGKHDYYRAPTPCDTPPKSPDEIPECPGAKRKKPNNSVLSESGKCQICGKNVLGALLKPEDIIRHAFYHANVNRFACSKCKRSSNTSKNINCACGTDRKIIDHTSPLNAPDEITRIAKTCFPTAYHLCF